MRHWLFLLAFASVFYVNGAGFIESFVNYPSWALIGSSDFVAYHKFISPRVIGFLVLPVLLASVFTALLLWRRPLEIPLWAVGVALALQVVAWVSTVTIQIPIQIQLSQGFSAELLGRLMETNLWFRRLPIGLCALLFLWMAARVFDSGEPRARASRNQ